MSRPKKTLSLMEVASYLFYDKDLNRGGYLEFVARQQDYEGIRGSFSKKEWQELNTFVNGTVRGFTDYDDDWSSPQVPAEWPSIRNKLIANGLLAQEAPQDAHQINWGPVESYLSSELFLQYYLDLEWGHSRLKAFGRSSGHDIVPTLVLGSNGAEFLRKMLEEHGIEPDEDGRFEKRVLDKLTVLRRGRGKSGRPMNKHFRGLLDDDAARPAIDYVVANRAAPFSTIAVDLRKACKAASAVLEEEKKKRYLRNDKDIATDDRRKEISADLEKVENEIKRLSAKCIRITTSIDDALTRDPALSAFCDTMLGDPSSWRVSEPKKIERFRRLRAYVLEHALYKLPVSTQRKARAIESKEDAAALREQDAGFRHLDDWKAAFWENKAPRWADILDGLETVKRRKKNASKGRK